MPIRLVVGLGNPGVEYVSTRHNAGFWILDQWTTELRATWLQEARFFGKVSSLKTMGIDAWLLKPQTWMNESGRSVQSFLQFYRFQPGELLVIHDELDLPPGTIKFKWGGGHGGHRGLKDIIQKIGTADFWRMRVGIGHPGEASKVVGYVLNPPLFSERNLIENAINSGLRVLPEFIQGNSATAMQQLHTTNL
jgi:PTH1 family peptidyl-tRNA hydrolase